MNASLVIESSFREYAMTPNPYLSPTPLPAPLPTKKGHKVRNFLVFPAFGVLGVGAVVAAVVFSHATPPAPPVPTTFTFTGSFALHGSYDQYSGADVYQEDGGGCHGQGGYSDIADGAQVVVTSGSDTLGVGQLANSTYTGGNCVFQFVVENVPLGKRFYGVAVTHRGTIQEPESEAKSGNVALSLGDGS